MDFHRPLGPWKSLKVKIEQELRAFMDSPIRSPKTLRITKNFKLGISHASKDHGTFFLLGGSSDYDSGGWVMSEVAKNLRLCIDEKERKIARYRAKYSEWWLLLADYIDFSMEPDDRRLFRTEVMPSIRHSFSRIVLIDPRDHRRTIVPYRQRRLFCAIVDWSS